MKAFDRVLCKLLLQVLRKIGVPIVNIMESLYTNFEIAFSVNEIDRIIINLVGVKQGTVSCKPNFIQTCHRNCSRGGTWFFLPDSQYADDTAVMFTSRPSCLHSRLSRETEPFILFFLGTVLTRETVCRRITKASSAFGALCKFISDRQEDQDRTGRGRPRNNKKK